MPDRIVSRVRRLGRLRIVPYRSFGPPDNVRFRGRVLANREDSVARAGERRRVAVTRMAGRFLSRQVAGVGVNVRIGRTARTVLTDGEGYFDVAIPLDDSVVRRDGWVTAQASVVGRSAGPWPLESVVLDADTSRVVISDVDDTLLVNATGDVLRTVLVTLGGSALTRRPVPGAPSVYSELTAATETRLACPVFYVSSSPWNLYDFLVAFLEHNGFPAGPLSLRDFGLNTATRRGAHRSHKIENITEILDDCPGASVVLIGDSSQEDAAAFAEIMTERPGRVVGAFIRDVSDQRKARAITELAASLPSAAGPMNMVGEMTEIARHLSETAWFD